MARIKVLCVDDEPNVLEGLSLHLRRKYDVETASGGAEALAKLEERGPFAVVLSDMQMPAMNGAELLRQVREAAPDSTRMLLTGHADVNAAIAAVNEGQVFRFMTKPCPPDQLLLAFSAAAEQHRLITAERVLLEQTLHGSIKTLTDILSLTNPVAFGRATRVKALVNDLARTLQLPNKWQVEMAAMLSQLGFVTLPEETAAKYYHGGDLTDTEKEMITRIPGVNEELLRNIPRLEPVLEILAQQVNPYREGGEKLPIGARLLRIAVDFDELESRAPSTKLTLETMLGREGTYDPVILREFARLKGSSDGRVVREIPLSAVQEGMIFADDVHMKSGLLLVTRGYEVTQSFLERTRNFKHGSVREPVRVVMKMEEEMAEVL